ncbi:MAG: hypothetical protein ACPHCZ_04550, partial [Candidatus Poseidoniaceae archaeon]
SSGGASAAALVAGGGLALLALATVLLRRRGAGKEDVKAALPAPGPTSKPKPKGPPGADRRVAGGPRAPPASPTQKGVDLARAEAALAALSPASTPSPDGEGLPEVGTVAKDHTELPGGGDYDYATEGTHYEGEGIGRWKLREDGSFERIE